MPTDVHRLQGSEGPSTGFSFTRPEDAAGHGDDCFYGLTFTIAPGRMGMQPKVERDGREARPPQLSLPVQFGGSGVEVSPEGQVPVNLVQERTAPSWD